MSDEPGSIRIAPRQGYTIVPNGVLPDGISARAWGVYVYLLSRPPGWVCRPRHLVTVFREGRDALYKVVNELVEFGLLTKEQFFVDGVPRFRYVLPEIPPNPEKPDTGNPEPEIPDLTQYRETTNTEKNQKNPRPGFDDFWQAYPKKRSKGQAERAWDKAIKHTDPTVLVHGAVEFAQWCIRAKEERQFIPYPASWLNAKGWLDEREEKPDTPPSNLQAHITLVREIAHNEGYEVGPPQLEADSWT